MTCLTQGFIIKKCPLGDYDLQCTIFTRELGKVTAIAKGAKRITSKLNAHLEPFLIGELMLAHGAVVKRVAAARIVKNYSVIKNDLIKIFAANYFLETIDLLVRAEAVDRELFDLADNFLFLFSSAESRAATLILLNKFLFKLLSHLGYQPPIKAVSQRQLFNQLHQLAQGIAEKRIKNADFLLLNFAL
jgi:DNA repair protein RecO (recombination protein O)